MFHLIKGVFDYRNNQLTQSQFTLAMHVDGWMWHMQGLAIISEKLLGYLNYNGLILYLMALLENLNANYEILM